ncbi:MAG: hypothetical protein Q4E69_00875, partial [Bacilli bacterium]|nr:hypothetical protein [Bacilli bacterium]
EQPTEEVVEDVQEEQPTEEVVEDNNDEETEEENLPLSDEIIEIPTFGGTEETVTEDIQEEQPTNEQSELEDMFNGNVLVNDEGVEQQEEYSIYDFRNNQDMQFDENYEPIIKPNEEIQIVPDNDEEETVEHYKDVIDSPNPDYDINSEIVGIKEEDTEDEDEITRTVEYDNNVIEINDTSYELSDEERIEEEEQEELEKEKQEEVYEDINEEYNPDMIPQDDDSNEVNLNEDIVIDSGDLENTESDTRKAIGADFVDADGPLLEEIPRLGTEKEDDFVEIEIESDEDNDGTDEDPFEDTLEFDPEAFKDNK